MRTVQYKNNEISRHSISTFRMPLPRTSNRATPLSTSSYGDAMVAEAVNDKRRRLRLAVADIPAPRGDGDYLRCLGLAYGYVECADL
jgi:hypothetical protein